MRLIVFLSIFLMSGVAHSQNITLGAYYFDGWGGKYRKTLFEDFPDRKPIWGWQTSTPEIMDQQLKLANDSGIKFFSFCWFFKREKDSAIVDNANQNNALKLYLKAKDKHQIRFSLMVANHAGFRITKSDWSSLALYWCQLFKDPAYLLVDGKPVITFFDIQSLSKEFGGPEGVKKAFQQLRVLATQSGLSGVVIAASVNSAEKAAVASNSGFDLLTGYNYHGTGLWNSRGNAEVPISNMRIQEKKLWSDISARTKLPYIPVITLNWDRRPLEKSKNVQSPHFSGFSRESVKLAIGSSKEWLSKNQTSATKEGLVVIYAWNEYGEGSWLTPSDNFKNSLLEGVKDGLKSSVKDEH